MKTALIACSLCLTALLSACGSPGHSNKAACEEFQYLTNRAYLVGEDIILDGDHYSEDMKNKVIPLADKDLTVALLKMLSIMEQTNRGSASEALQDLKNSTQTLYESCKSAGVNLAN